jgi:sulfopyruvate decarboxylase TPP-binding subunit
LSWHTSIVKVLKANDVRLVTYIPDNVLAPLISAVHADAWFKVICPAREEEAAGIVAGAYMAGLRGIVLMQTSGFATLPNVCEPRDRGIRQRHVSHHRKTEDAHRRRG